MSKVMFRLFIDNNCIIYLLLNNLFDIYGFLGMTELSTDHFYMCVQETVSCIVIHFYAPY